MVARARQSGNLGQPSFLCLVEIPIFLTARVLSSIEPADRAGCRGAEK